MKLGTFIFKIRLHQEDTATVRFKQTTTEKKV